MSHGMLADVWVELVKCIKSGGAPTLDAFKLASNDLEQHVKTLGTTNTLENAQTTSPTQSMDDKAAEITEKQKPEESLPEFNSRMRNKSATFVMSKPDQDNWLLRVMIEPWVRLLDRSLFFGSNPFLI